MFTEAPFSKTKNAEMRQNFCRQMGNCEEELPKKPVGRLSVNCQPSVGQQVTDSLPTTNQKVTDRLRKKKNCGKKEQLT